MSLSILTEWLFILCSRLLLVEVVLKVSLLVRQLRGVEFKNEILSKSKNHAFFNEKGVVSGVAVLICVGVVRPHPFSEPR